MGHQNEENNPPAPSYANVQKHILKYSQPDDSIAWKGLAATIASELCASFMILNGLPTVGWVLHSLNMVRFFILFHDMAHFSYFKSIPLNKLFGSLIGVYVYFPFQAWRDGHNHHHRHFGNLDRLDMSQTILFTKKKYESWSLTKRIIVRIFREPIVFFLFTSPLLWFVGLNYIVAKRYGVISKPFF